MADGQGCLCYAYGRSECSCDADWTPQEVYDLKAKLAATMKEADRLKADNKKLRQENSYVIACLKGTKAYKEAEELQRQVDVLKANNEAIAAGYQRDTERMREGLRDMYIAFGGERGFPVGSGVETLDQLNAMTKAQALLDRLEGK